MLDLFLKDLEGFVKIKSLKDELLEFLKHVSYFPRLIKVMQVLYFN